MKLPPWKPETDDERWQFTSWVLSALDNADEQEVAHGNNPFVLRLIQNRINLVNLARETDDPIVFPEPKRKRGGTKKQVADMTAFERAAHDVPRIRALFVKHWGKRNRMVRPLAEEIAAQRWALSAADTDRLIDKFQRKS